MLRGGVGVYYNVVVAQTYNNFLRGNGLDVINVNVDADDRRRAGVLARQGAAADRRRASSPTCA